MHTANGEDFVSILTSGEIRASRCDVFVGEFLVYFFLGRPAYKTPIVHDPSYWQLPAVFVFESLDQYVPKRIFPFDSGAFSDSRFQEIIGHIDMELFDIGSDPTYVSALIGTFFSTTGRYEKAQPISYEKVSKLIANDLSNFVPLALAKLYNHSLNQYIDDRARLVEIQYDTSISLAVPPLKGVICCREWCRDPKIESALKALGCKVATYPILPLNSSSYYSKIYELAEEMK